MAKTFKIRDKETGEVFTVREKSLIERELSTPRMVDRLAGTMISGPSMSVNPPKNPEDLAPLVSGGVGTGIGSMTGSTIVTPALMSGLGEAGRQGIRQLRRNLGEDVPQSTLPGGDMASPAYTAGGTAAANMGISMITKAPFMQKFIGKALKRVGEEYGKTVDKMGFQGVKVPANEIKSAIKAAVNGSSLPADKEAMVKFFAKQFGIKKITGKSVKEVLDLIPENINARQVGDLLRIMNQKFEDIFEKQIGRTAAGAFGNARNMISSSFKNSAIREGYPEVVQMMNKISGLNKKLDLFQSAGSGAGSIAAGGVLGTGVGALLGNPYAGGGVGTILGAALNNPIINQLLFKGVSSPLGQGITQAARTTIPPVVQAIGRKEFES